MKALEFALEELKRHIQGYHEGTLSDVEVKEELMRAREYVDYVEKILKNQLS